jgi:hypothetical protein
LDDILSPTNNNNKIKQPAKPTNVPSNNHDDLDDLDDFLGNIGPKTTNKP